MGPPFFWVLFFGGAKKSTSAVGPRPDSQITRRPSDTKNQNQNKKYRCAIGNTTAGSQVNKTPSART